MAFVLKYHGKLKGTRDLRLCFGKSGSELARKTCLTESGVNREASHVFLNKDER